MEKWLAYSPSTLQFDVVLHQQNTTLMDMKNVSSEPLAFKVKTNKPTRYSVQPNSATMNPGDALTVKFSQMAFQDFPQDMDDCPDKFQLLMIPLSQVPMGPHESSAFHGHESISDLWKVAPVNAIVKVKISIVLVAVREKVPFPFIDPSPIIRTAPVPPIFDDKVSEGKSGAPDISLPEKKTKALPFVSSTVSELTPRRVIDNSLEVAPTDTAVETGPSLSDVQRKTEEIEVEFKKMVNIKSPVLNSQIPVPSRAESQPNDNLRQDSSKILEVARSVRSALTETTDSVNATIAEFSKIPEGTPALQPQRVSTEVESPNESIRPSLEIETGDKIDILPVSPSVTTLQKEATDRLDQPRLPPTLETEAPSALVDTILPSADEGGSGIDTATTATTTTNVTFKEEKDNTNDNDDEDDDDIDYQSPEYSRSRLMNINITPAMTVPDMDKASRQRIAIERAGELVREINAKAKQIDTLNQQLVEARHRLSDARMATRPAYDVRFEVVESSRVPLPQLIIMAVISVALFGLLV